MIRGIGLRSGIAINVITMIGIGPLITMPLVLAQLAGPLALAGWIAGAIVALCDGLVWAELSSRYPGSGGTYVYLREVFGRESWGRLFAFLFNWQFLLFAPCLLATGYIGFASYFGYLAPAVAASHAAQVAIAIAVGIATVVLLYRRITIVAAIGSAFAVVAVGTLLLVTAAAFSRGTAMHALTIPPHAALGIGFITGLGHALYITLYDYLGYSDAALMGDEVRRPQRTIPAAIVLSIVIVAALYVTLQVGVLVHGVPHGNPQFIASTIVAQSWGINAARAVTVLILITAFASVFGNLAGFARIPYAAAKDGEFFRPFAHLHARDQFPDVALVVIGAAALAACFFSLDQVIAILTAGIVLIQGVMQIVALFVMRAQKERAPFRMLLYPLPALIALGGWLYAFANTGGGAIGLGMGWLALGITAYLFTARAQRRWPFAVALTIAASLLLPQTAAAAPWPGSAVVHRDGYPIYTVAGRPFFVYGAAFFYERIPRRAWAASLDRYRALGINTIDLYVMWNWHEPAAGQFDFTGRSNDRRDLTGLMRLIAGHGFKVIVRPGPVIRNEWRNGGYPDWLLRRPEYHMPLRDVLEGRYPATATLQNAHSDDAAAEWLRNATHLRSAARWLQAALRAIAPWRSSVIAIAIDDDQGAYLDNQTWPAPHLQQYIRHLGSIVRGVVGPRVPLFINTYEMKVTPSAPVWAWGNWYQSDAYSIGAHDRAQLQFSTGLLGTQPDLPIMMSEFQAGWLQGADEGSPRAADPANTTLALNTLLQAGAHGVVNFPVQDTLNPAGWEAPWANAFYSWDAALALQLRPQARFTPTQRFGDGVRRYGDELARTHVRADAAIAYLTSAYDAHTITNERIFQIAQTVMDAQRDCNELRITCAVTDLRYEPVNELLRYPVLIVPGGGNDAFIPEVSRKLARYGAAGRRIVLRAADAHVRAPAAGGIPGAALLVDPTERYGFLSIVNYASSALHTDATRIRAARLNAALPALTVSARDAVLIPVSISGILPSAEKQPGKSGDSLQAFKSDSQAQRVPLRPDAYVKARLQAHSALVYRSNLFDDGYPAVVLENDRIRVVVSPCAGARAFIFEDKRASGNLFTTVGGFRDAWTPQLPPSPRDYIAKYTHPLLAGTFNRCYSSRISATPPTPTPASGMATFVYTAPDAPGRATFRRTIVLHSDDDYVTVFSAAHFLRGVHERAQQITSLALSDESVVVEGARGIGVFERRARRATLVSWDSSVANHRIDRGRGSLLLTLSIGAGETARVRYGISETRNAAAVQAALAAFAKRR